MTSHTAAPRFRTYAEELRKAGYDGPIQGLLLRRTTNGDVRHAEVEVMEDLGPQIEAFGGGEISAIDSIQEDGFDWMVIDLGGKRIDPSTFIPDLNHRSPAEPYWAPIRRAIGHRTIYSPGTSVLVQREDGRFVAVRRTDDGQWSLPAGAREPGETILSTAHHEIREETGLTIRLTDLVGIVSGPRMSWTYPNGHRSQFTSFLFRARHVAGDLVVGDHENTDVAWLTAEEARAKFSPRWAERLEMFLAESPHVAIY